MAELFRNTPLPEEELMVNLHLYMRSSVLAKVCYVKELYERIVDLPGIVMEFGTWWGANMVLFENLRAIHEPYNYSRRIVGFDTFEGYKGITEKDGNDDLVFEGNYGVSGDAAGHLRELLDTHERENVMGHIRKSEVICGDVVETLPRYLAAHPETIVSLAYLDMQIYKPTEVCLKAIEPYLVKGSVLAMDELNCPEFPGETEAFREVFGTKESRLIRSRYLPDRCYYVHGL